MPVGPWKVLRERNYALLWWSSALSDLGTWMQIGALAIFVTESTGQARWTGIAGTVTYLAVGLLGPFGGLMADRFDRRKLIIVGALGQAVVGSAMVLCFATGLDTPLVLIAMAGVQGCFAAAGNSAFHALVPDLVAKARLANAAFLSQISWNLGRSVGPVLAVGAIHLRSYALVFLINAITYVVVAICVSLVRVPSVTHAKEAGSVAVRLRSGWNGLLHNRICRWALAVGLVEMIFVAPFIALIPAMGQLTLHGSPASSGVLFFMQGIGSVAGLVLIGSVMHRFGQGRTFVGLMWFAPLALAAYALSPNIVTAAILIVPLAALHSGVFGLSGSFMQQFAETHVRGRVISLQRSMFNIGMAGSASAAAVLVDIAGLRTVLLTMSAAAVLLMVWFAFGASKGLHLLRGIKGGGEEVYELDSASEEFAPEVRPQQSRAQQR